MPKLTSIARDWPDCIRGDPAQPVPRNARIQSGTLFVPRHLPAGSLAHMEEAYRSILWPPCTDFGFNRLAREFVWEQEGRVLHYRIIDVPSKPKEKGND